jgi:hypothetical protein
LVKVAVAPVVVVVGVSKVAVGLRAVVEAHRVAVVVTKAVGETKSRVAGIYPAMISHVGRATALIASSSTNLH